MLAPSHQTLSRQFSRADANPMLHAQYLGEMQRLRGRIYLSDGAIQPWQLTADGRHQLDTDERSWHLLLMDAQGQVCGCARYLPYDPETPFEQLGVRSAALAEMAPWSGAFRAAAETELAKARQRRISYAEVGGWAIDEEHRGTRDALRVALATFALGQLLGQCIGMTTATVRHGSAGILRKIGGAPLAFEGREMPAYYDPQYDCEMQILRFDSSQPNPRYAEWVGRLREELEMAPVIFRKSGTFSHIFPESAGFNLHGYVS
ncbi:MAG TPA: hypothetical protein VG672_24600 [Bryobacteraceae bacterium]|nr:hypothetical protein [Bryobacteraceae bacterium]